MGKAGLGSQPGSPEEEASSREWEDVAAWSLPARLCLPSHSCDPSVAERAGQTGRRAGRGRRLTAGYVQQLAVDGGDPQVGGAGVKDDCEALWGGPNADFPVVLGLWGGSVHQSEGRNPSPH